MPSVDPIVWADVYWNMAVRLDGVRLRSYLTINWSLLTGTNVSNFQYFTDVYSPIQSRRQIEDGRPLTRR